jgi:hypothetical protein
MWNYVPIVHYKKSFQNPGGTISGGAETGRKRNSRRNKKRGATPLPALFLFLFLFLII